MKVQTMNCQDISHSLECYLDAELCKKDQSEFEKHVSLCVSCRDVVGEQRTLHTLIRQGISEVPFHPELTTSVFSVLPSPESQTKTTKKDIPSVRRVPAWLSSWLLPGMASVVGAAALLLFVQYQWQPQDSPMSVAESALGEHVKPPPLEVTGAAISPWLAKQAPKQIVLPQFGSSDIQLVGARRSILDGKIAFHLVYQVDASRQIHLHVLQTSNVSIPYATRHQVSGRDVWTFRQYHRNIVATQDLDETLYLFSSGDLSRTQLFDLVRKSSVLNP